MADRPVRWYILFDNYEQGLALHALLDEHSLPNRISPAPRCLKEAAACGMALLIGADVIESVRACIEQHSGEYRVILPVEGQLLSHRDKYC
ncbi:MAG: DUF3343 domain-containing protein [Oscillospiraceae bacterium]|nr:DUF3343 domain-containing protein [Oscillospiraceae bacterium]